MASLQKQQIFMFWPFFSAFSNGTEGIDFGQEPARPLTNLIMLEQFATKLASCIQTPTTAIFQSESACY